MFSPNDEKFNLDQIIYSREHQFISSGIYFYKSIPSIIKKIYTSQSMKVLVYIVLIAYTEVQVEIFYQTQPYFDDMIDAQGILLGKGSEGRVILIPQVDCVVKQISFCQNSNSFSKTMMRALHQFAISKLVACFRLGPKVLRPYMFDMICTERNVYFFLEECLSFEQSVEKLLKVDSEKDMYKNIEQSLKESLFLLDKLKIIHYDIKPDNIMWSPSYNKFMFLDYGISQSKSFCQGLMQKETFKGTFSYCSQDMRRLMLQGVSDFVDVYFNDCFCLEKSLQIFKRQIVQIAQKWKGKNHIKNQCNFNSMEGLSLSQIIQKNNNNSNFKQQNLLFHLCINPNNEFKKQNMNVQNSIKPQYNKEIKFMILQFMIYKEMNTNLNHYYEKYQSEIQENLASHLSFFFQFGKFIHGSKIFPSFVKRFFPKEILRLSTNQSPQLVDLSQEEKLINVNNEFPFLLPYYQLFQTKKPYLINKISRIFERIQQEQSQNLMKLTLCQPFSNNYIYYTIFEYLFFIKDYLMELTTEIIFGKFNRFVLRIIQYFNLVGQKFPSFNGKSVRIQTSTNEIQTLNIIKESLNLVIDILSNCDITMFMNSHKYDRSLIYVYSNFNILCNLLDRSYLFPQIDILQKHQMTLVYFTYFEILNFKLQQILTSPNFQLTPLQINQADYFIKTAKNQIAHQFQFLVAQLVQSMYSEDIHSISSTLSKNDSYLTKFELEKLKLDNNLQALNTNKILKSLEQPYSRLKQNLNSFVKETSYCDTLFLYKKIQQIAKQIFFSKPFLQVQKVQNQIQKIKNMLQMKSNFQKIILHDHRKIIIQQIFVQCLYKVYIKNGCLFKPMQIIQNRIRYLIEKLKETQQLKKAYSYNFYRYLSDLQMIYNFLGLYTTNKNLQQLKKIFKPLQKNQVIPKKHCFNSLSQSPIITSPWMKFYHTSKAFSVYQNFRINFVIQQQKIIQKLTNLTKNHQIYFLQIFHNCDKKQSLLENLLLSTPGQKLGAQFIKVLVKQKEYLNLNRFLFGVSLTIVKNEGGILAITNFMTFFLKKTIHYLSQQIDSLSNKKNIAKEFILELIRYSWPIIDGQVQNKNFKTEFNKQFTKISLNKAILLLVLGLLYYLGKLICFNSKSIEKQSASHSLYRLQSKQMFQTAFLSLQFLRKFILKILKDFQTNLLDKLKKTFSFTLAKEENDLIIELWSDMNGDSGLKPRFGHQLEPDQFFSYLIKGYFGVQYQLTLRGFYYTIASLLKTIPTRKNEFLLRKQFWIISQLQSQWIFKQIKSLSLKGPYYQILKLNMLIKSIQLRVLRNSHGYSFMHMYVPTNKRDQNQIQNCYMSNFLSGLKNSGSVSLSAKNSIQKIMKKKFSKLDKIK